jgi:hypothetical protein
LPAEVWQCVIYVKKRLIYETRMKGEGCCPMIIGRLNPNPDWPWGHGPLMQYLPTLRQVDELEIARNEHTDLSLRPPMGYPDDSFAAIEQGLEPGMAYPIRPGTEGAIKPIYTVTPPDIANYAYEEKLKHLRRGFYVDFPEQTGETPPTLGQWLDEMARAQRRIGRPGLPFWREFCAPVFTRFKYLLERAGAVQPITINGTEVSLRPLNPAQRAAEQQEIAMATHFLQIAGQFFPEEFKVQIDGLQTMKAILAKMRVDNLVSFRDPKHIQAALSQISQLMGGQQPGGQAAPAQPGVSGLPLK